MKIQVHTTPEFNFVPIPKCAGTSIIAAMFRLKGLSPSEIHRCKKPRKTWVPDGTLTIAVIRDPVERAISTWKNKVHDTGPAGTMLVNVCGFDRGMGFSDYINRLYSEGLINIKDNHVNTQMSFIQHGACVEEAHNEITLICMSKLASEWSRLGLESIFGPLGHLNQASQTIPILDTTTYAKILSLYSDDFDLWNSVTS